MDSFEINKIIAAVLLIALLVIGIGKISDIAFRVDKPEKSAYKVDIQESSQISSSTAEKIEEKVDISVTCIRRYFSWRKSFKKCSVPFSKQGGENKIGPALYGVIGRKCIKTRL